MAARGTQGFRLSRMRLDGFATFRSKYIQCVGGFGVWGPEYAKSHSLAAGFTTTSTTPVIVATDEIPPTVILIGPDGSDGTEYVPGKLHGILLAFQAKVSEGGSGTITLLDNDDTTVLGTWPIVETSWIMKGGPITGMEADKPGHLYASVAGPDQEISIKQIVQYAEEELVIPAAQRTVEWWLA